MSIVRAVWQEVVYMSEEAKNKIEGVSDLYIYHPGTGTYLSLSECVIARLEDIPEAQE